MSILFIFPYYFSSPPLKPEEFSAWTANAFITTPDSKNGWDKIMKSEMPEFEKLNNIHVEQKRQEISPEQKKILGEVWTEMVVDNSDTPKNISGMTTEEIKKWLFESAMKDVESFTNELGLKNDQVLIEKIQKTENLGEKSALELKYIRNVHAQVDSLVHNFDRSENKSTKWDSWPKRMRETKEFNCVGATLLGINLLEKGGIKSYYGNPGGHVVNIAKLSNGEWWYVDFRNGKQNIIRIEPEETFLADVPVLKINHPGIGYKLIPIYENSEATCSILSNLASLKHAAENKNIPDENIEKKEAKEYLEKYKSNFEKTNFSLFHQTLYSKFIEVEKTKEMRGEIRRIDNMREFEKPIHNYTKILSKEQKMAIIEEIKKKKESIENLFYKNDQSVLQKSIPELKKILELYLENLGKIKENQPEIYKEAVDKIIDGIRKL